MKSFLSNQLNKSIYHAIQEAQKCGETTIGLDFFLLGLLGEKNSLAFKIFQKTYQDHQRVLKNLKELIYDFHKKKNYSEKEKKELEISFTPALENLLFKNFVLDKNFVLERKRKENLVMTTKDIFFLLLSSKRLSFYLKKANQKI